MFITRVVRFVKIQDINTCASLWTKYFFIVIMNWVDVRDPIIGTPHCFNVGKEKGYKWG